jgi:hypothetical protein
MSQIYGDYYDDYSHYRCAFIAAETQDKADYALTRMLERVTMRMPDLDDIRCEPWPGDKT